MTSCGAETGEAPPQALSPFRVPSAALCHISAVARAGRQTAPSRVSKACWGAGCAGGSEKRGPSQSLGWTKACTHPTPGLIKYYWCLRPTIEPSVVYYSTIPEGTRGTRRTRGTRVLRRSIKWFCTFIALDRTQYH
ncbi:hypothetical protein O988_09317 [Pseudogymnoascus sp. VKM F-3808]|nr:hypothetical protein O988_09317 [Pseudogymnoascus sp. VKM F-3808]